MIRGLLNHGNMPGTFPAGPNFISKTLYIIGCFFDNPLIFKDILISSQPEAEKNIP